MQFNKITPNRLNNKFFMKSSQIKNKQYWKQRIKSQIERRNWKKQIFGDHYNLSSIKLNNNKKYFNEEVKIMEIERTNRMLLQKIKKISERSKPKIIIERARTEAIYNEENIERSQTQEKINLKKQLALRRHRYQSVQSMLQRTRLKAGEAVQRDAERTNQTQHRKTTIQQKPLSSQIVILYKGPRQIQSIRFLFRIFIKDGKYTIMSKTKISQQKIQIPQENYNTLLKQQLENYHMNIFRYLKLVENNKLQFDFKNSRKIEVDVIEKTGFQLPLIRKKTYSDAHVEK